MTMLDKMRRHKSWLKWSLILVCLAFVVFYIPDFLRGTGADAAAGDTVASIEGQLDHRRRVPQHLSGPGPGLSHRLRRPMNDQLLKQLGVEQQILQQMVDERAAMAEAIGSASASATKRSASASCRFRRSRRAASSSANSGTSSCSRRSGRR